MKRVIVCFIFLQVSLFSDNNLTPPTYPGDLLIIESEIGGKRVCLESYCFFNTNDNVVTISLSGKDIKYDKVEVKVDLENSLNLLNSIHDYFLTFYNENLTTNDRYDSLYENYYLNNYTVDFTYDSKSFFASAMIKYNSKTDSFKISFSGLEGGSLNSGYIQSLTFSKDQFRAYGNLLAEFVAYKNVKAISY